MNYISNKILIFVHIIYFFILSCVKNYHKLQVTSYINPLNAELDPIRHLLALVGARHIVHVSRIRVK
jgi:hypothetical protein